MGDIHVTIKEDGENGKTITLKEVNHSVYKIDDPLASPDRIFIRNEENDINDIAMYALMHLSLRKRKFL